MSIVTHIGTCELPDGPPGEVMGYWQQASCAEYNSAIETAGGKSSLHVWSALTDLDGEYGPPTIFTCWGTDDLPVAAHGGHPDKRKPCEHTHAVFVAAMTAKEAQ